MDLRGGVVLVLDLDLIWFLTVARVDRAESGKLVRLVRVGLLLVLLDVLGYTTVAAVAVIDDMIVDGRDMCWSCMLMHRRRMHRRRSCMVMHRRRRLMLLVAFRQVVRKHVLSDDAAVDEHVWHVIADNLH